MESIGIQLNYRMNPADFFMLEISKLKENSGYITPLNSENFNKRIHALSEGSSVLALTKQQVLLTSK